jgi:hypothetical protein
VSAPLGGSARQSGLTWVALHYVLGLERLGFDVALIEPLAKARQPDGPLAPSAEGRWFDNVMRRFGLRERSSLLDQQTGETVGLSYTELREFARRTDLLLNLSGSLKDEDLLGAVRQRAYLDLDPAFTQLWQEVEGIDMGFAGHDLFFTVGQSIGTPDCDLPTCGIDWTPVLPPVVLDLWPSGGQLQHDALTTVANWRGYGSIRLNGTLYGQKAHSLRPLLDLPERTGARFALALGIHSGEEEDLRALELHGWEILDPLRMAGDPDAYWWFVRGSKAEFGIAKSGYVVSRCGWFSDRSACYLAAGRPVVAQDTGFGAVLPTGEGLFAFTTSDDVSSAVDALRSDYDRHARAARALAMEHLASERVLGRILEKAT